MMHISSDIRVRGVFRMLNLDIKNRCKGWELILALHLVTNMQLFQESPGVSTKIVACKRAVL